jgi:ComF family protein
MKILTRLWDWLNPPHCLLCGQSAYWLCPFCSAKFKKIKPACFACGQAGDGSFCPDCGPAWALDGIISAASYADENIRQIIKLYKYRLIRPLFKPLAGLMAETWKKQDPLESETGGPAYLVAVPLKDRRERWRGFNQSKLLAEHLSASLGLPRLNDLRRKGRHPHQADLGQTERKRNLIGAFYWDGISLEDADVILIDDVVTTGQTLNQAARALKAGGAENVWALTIARGGHMKNKKSG